MTMATSRRGLVGLILFWLVAPVNAQPPQTGNGLPQPRLLSVSPMGGKTGSTVELTFTGTDVEDPQGLYFSHSGIKAEPIVPPAPPPPDPKNPPKTPPTPPAITRFKVTIAADVPAGTHDVRFINKFGISNPRAFVIGDLPEILEKEPNNDVPQAQRIEVGSTVNGGISAPADVDYYSFAGKKGQRIAVNCQTTGIDSRLQAALELYTSDGKLLANNRGYREGDALLDAVLPADGDYLIRVHEFTYAFGGPQHFYRLTVSTAPWIDAIHPPMIEPGKASLLTIYGRNLPGGQPDPQAGGGRYPLEKLTVSLQAPGDPLQQQRLAYHGLVSPMMAGIDGFEYILRGPNGASNPCLVTYAHAPVLLDQGPNDTMDKAQEVTVPCEIAGRIEKRKDRDWYAFTAKKGETFLIDGMSNRLGTQAYLSLSLLRADNKQVIKEFDDLTDTLSPVKFFTRCDDPAPYRFTAPADGKYYLLAQTRDADTRGGVQQFYRIRISAERPDYRLILMPPADNRPDSTVVPQGGHQYFTVFVWRQDGFNGDVKLTAEGLPKGVTCPPQIVGKGLRQGTLVVSAAADAPEWAGDFKIKGTATIGGQPVVREARSAGVIWPVQQPNIPTLSRLEHSLVLAVRPKPPFSLTATVDKDETLPAQKLTALLKVQRLWPDFKAALTVTAADLPPNIVVNNGQPMNIPADKNELSVPIEIRSGVLPGLYTFALRCAAQIPYNKDPMAKQKPNIALLYPSTPITLTILPGQVANVTLAKPTLGLKVGAQEEIVVKVSRINEYAGELKVQVALPTNAKGVSVDEGTIPAGVDEVKLILRSSPEAAAGNYANIPVKVTATLKPGVTVNQEAKLTLNVTK